MCDKFHTPLRMVQVWVFIFVLKSQKLAVFEAKKGLQKQLWQPILWSKVNAKQHQHMKSQDHPATIAQIH